MTSPKFWPILPAAGVGSRMQADRPKQYLTLQNRYLIDHTLALMLSYPAFERLVLVLSADDPYWPHSDFASDMRIIRAAGGSERLAEIKGVEGNGYQPGLGHRAPDGDTLGVELGDLERESGIDALANDGVEKNGLSLLEG